MNTFISTRVSRSINEAFKQQFNEFISNTTYKQYTYTAFKISFI